MIFGDGVPSTSVGGNDTWINADVSNSMTIYAKAWTSPAKILFNHAKNKINKYAYYAKNIH